MASRKLRKRSNPKSENDPLSTNSVLPSQEQHNVDELHPDDAKKVCHFCLRVVASMESGEEEIGQIYVQLTGEKSVHNILQKSRVSEMWCTDCASHMRQAVQTVILVRQANTFWTNYQQAWSLPKLVDGSDVVKMEVELDPALKLETSEACFGQDTKIETKHEFNNDDHHDGGSPQAFDDDDDAEDAVPDHHEHHDESISDSPISQAKAKKPQRKTTAAVASKKPNAAEPKPKNKRKQKNTPQVCHLCGCVYQKLAVHMEAAHSTFICDLCDRTFNHKITLRRHFRDDHGFYRYSCDVCKLSNLTRSTWKRHQDMHRPESEHTYVCDQCDNRYSTKQYLRLHVARVHVVEEVECKDCGKMYRNMVALRIHMIRHQPKTLTCPQAGCPRMFWQTKEMKEHCRTVHQKDRKYKCEVCGKAFLMNAQVKQHHKLGRCPGAAGSSDAAQSSTSGRRAGARKEQQPPAVLHEPQQPFAVPAAIVQSDQLPPPQLSHPPINADMRPAGAASSMLSMLHSSAQLMGSMETDPNRTAASGFNLSYIPPNFKY